MVVLAVTIAVYEIISSRCHIRYTQQRQQMSQKVTSSSENHRKIRQRDRETIEDSAP